MNRLIKSNTDIVRRAEEALKELPFCLQAVKLKAIIALGTADILEVARITCYSPNSLRNWVKRFNSEGLPGLYTRPRKYRPPKLTEPQTAELLGLLDDGKKNWTLRMLKEEISNRFNVSMSINGIWLLLKRKGYSHITARPVHYKQQKGDIEGFKKKSRN